jgi:hypothetical protein|tara:strand:+ start:965 stop:1225 length:261 start_codon:yes stop_codon:yes gene_type:complete
MPKEEEQRWRLEDAFRFKTDVERMLLLDADKVKKDPKMKAILKQAHATLGKLVSGNVEDDTKKELRKMGFGEKRESDGDDEEGDEE